MSSKVELRVDDEDVLIVTLNRPEMLNALDIETLHALSAAWDRAASTDIRCVVVTGAGKGFCAGADIKSPREGLDPSTSGLRHTYNPHVLAMAALEKPVIAAVNGVAAGAGLSLACAADIRVVADTARFVPSFATIGLVPDAGGTFFIPRILGYSRAFEWLASGRKLTADEAFGWGLANEVVSSENLEKRAIGLAHELAAQPGGGVALTKRALNLSARRHLTEQLDVEVELQNLALKAPGRAEARARMIENLAQKPSRTS